nr:2-amino-4-hydroxy-6-hydroxymethyldihydropteridine diphosphokinase [Silvibacterium bohemicum]
MQCVAYIGIGSNQPLGDRQPEQLVAAAVRELEGIGRVRAVSSLYATQPVGFADQPSFINAAVELETVTGPEKLLGALIEIERRYGRNRSLSVPKGPRSLDLDLLFMACDGLPITLDSPTLTLPHPEAPRRRFVLAPLAEIAPGLRHPVSQKSIAELLAELPDEGSNAIGAVRCFGNTVNIASITGKGR